jgi:hypothetical protein
MQRGVCPILRPVANYGVHGVATAPGLQRIPLEIPRFASYYAFLSLQAYFDVKKYACKSAVGSGGYKTTDCVCLRSGFGPDFIARLAALVPKLRVNLTRFHGVFAPNRTLPATPGKCRARPPVQIGWITRP